MNGHRASRVRRAAPRLAVAALVPLIHFVPGCKSPQAGDQAIAPEPLTYAEIRSTYNERTSSLASLYATGVIELHWKDTKEAGGHPDQGDLELWIEQPSRVALRIHKLDEPFFWLGCDEERVWIFDLAADPTMVTLGPVGASFSDELPVAGDPAQLFDLLALKPLPREGVVDGAVAWNEATDSWTVRVQRGEIVTSFSLDRVTLLPSVIELHDRAGTLVARSTIDPSRWRTAEVPGLPLTAWPKMPSHIDIDAPGAAANVRIALGDATTNVAEQPMDRVFDVDRLLRALQPAEIRRVTPGGGEP